MDDNLNQTPKIPTEVDYNRLLAQYIVLRNALIRIRDDCRNFDGDIIDPVGWTADRALRSTDEHNLD